MFWHLIAAIVLTGICIYVVSWANYYLFTYLGDDNGQMIFTYHALTIPARIFAMGFAILTMFLAITAWTSFIGMWIF